MKGLLRKFCGVVGAIGIGGGLLFRLQYYPGANVVLIIGMVFRVIQFLLTPAAYRTFSPFGTIRRNQKRVLQVFQFVSLGLVIVAAIFRLQHYPGASVLNVLGWGCLTVMMVLKALQDPEIIREEVDISDFGKKEQ